VNKLCKYAVRVEELSSEDEWLQEDEWDEIYKRSVESKIYFE